MNSPSFDPRAEQEFVNQVLSNNREHQDEIDRRLSCVPRILTERNRSIGSPLNDDEIHDAIQDTFVVILRRLPSYTPTAPLESWIYGVCCIQLRHALRNKQKKSQRIRALPEDSPAPQHRSVADLVTDQAEAFAALEMLGGIESDVLRLKHMEGLTFEEIATRLGVPRNTAKTHYYRGLANLREALIRREARRDQSR